MLLFFLKELFSLEWLYIQWNLKYFLTDEIIDKILNQGRFILSDVQIRPRQMASIIGLLIHEWNIECPLHYRALERDEDRILKMNINNNDPSMICYNECHIELNWWCDNLQTFGTLIYVYFVKRYLYFDVE